MDKRRAMATNVVGFAPPGDDWKRMKAFYDVSPSPKSAVPEPGRPISSDRPPIVRHQFVRKWAFGRHDKPWFLSVMNLGQTRANPNREWNDSNGAGYEVEIDKLSKNCKTIRFYNSWWKRRTHL